MLHNQSVQLPSRRVAVTGLLLTAMVIAAALLAGLRFRPSLAVAASPEAVIWYRCTPANVASYVTRIHVKCTVAASGGIQYFAYPTRETANASRFLSILTTAAVAGKQVDILYDPADTSGASYGCGVSDCRPITGVALLP
ncbi:MAG: hypothetical protein IT330_06395 [Anaerolineae bacterium]|nr:hypothetical protein [Anaerolineae bacterium]